MSVRLSRRQMLSSALASSSLGLAVQCPSFAQGADPLRNVMMVMKQLSDRQRDPISNRVLLNGQILLSLTRGLSSSRSTVRY